MARRSTKPSPKRKRVARPSRLHVRDFRRLGLAANETRADVIRAAVTKESAGIQARSAHWIPHRLDDQLAAIASTGYRLLDPRFRTDSMERVYLAYPISREEEEIPSVDSLVAKMDNSRDEFASDQRVSEGMEWQGGLEGLMNQAVALVLDSEVDANGIQESESLAQKRDIVRLLQQHDEEIENEKGFLSILRRWMTLSGIVVGLFSASALGWQLSRSGHVSLADRNSESLEASQPLDGFVGSSQGDVNLAESNNQVQIEQTETPQGSSNELSMPPALDSDFIESESLAFRAPAGLPVGLSDNSSASTVGSASPGFEAMVAPMSSVALQSDLVETGAPSQTAGAQESFASEEASVVRNSDPVSTNVSGRTIDKGALRESRFRLVRVLKMLEDLSSSEGDRVSQLRKLLQESPEASVDRLAILESLAKLSTRAYGLEKGMSVCDQIETEYGMEAWQIRYDLFKSNYLSGKSFTEHGKTAELGLRLCQKALIDNQLTIANHLIRLTIGVASRSRDERIQSLAHDLQREIISARQLSRAS